MQSFWSTRQIGWRTEHCTENVGGGMEKKKTEDTHLNKTDYEGFLFG